ncbi:MAG: tetratricopeptide repeat protein [bacterium]
MTQRVRMGVVALAMAAVAVLAPAASGAEDPALRRGRIYYNTGKYSKAIGELRTALRRNNRDAAAHLWVGKAYARTSDFDKALEHLKNAIKYEPGNEEAYRELGSTYRELASRARAKGDREAHQEYLARADEVADDLLALKPKDKESYEFLGGLAKDRQDFDTALSYLEKVLQIDPNDVSTHLERIEILRRQNRIEELKARCHELLKINPAQRQPKIILARIAMNEGNTEEALGILTRMIEAKKSDWEARLERAQIYLAEKRYEEALADANEALRLTNRNPFANFIRGSIYMRLKKLEDAIHEYQQAAAALPNHLPSHFWLARCYLMDDQLREAIDELNVVVKINPRFTPARLVLASAHLQQGYPDGAINVLQEGLHYDRENVEVRRLLGVAYLHKGDHDQALTHFSEMAKQDRDAPRAHQILAGIALAKGEVDKAVRHCLKALDVEPKNVDVHFLLGLAYLRRNRLDGAKRQFERVLELRGRHPGARMNLAAVHLRLREFDLAQEQYQRCIEEDPTLTKPRYNLARLYILQRKFDRAEGELNQLLKVDAEKAKVHLALAELHRAKGETDKALQAAKAALGIDPKLHEARTFMARLHMADQNWSAALKEFDAALAEDPEFADAYEAAVIQVYLGRYDEAVSLFEKAIQNDVDRAKMLAGAAAALQLQGDYREALANITQAEKGKGQDPLVALQTANIYLAQGDAANARTIVRQAHYVPETVSAAYGDLLDQFAADRAKAKSAADALTRIIFYGARGWHTEAEQNCNLLLKLAPKNTFAHTVLANTYRATRKPEKEIEIVRKLVDVAPEEPRHRLRLGNLYVRVSRFKEARQQYEKAVQLAPNDVDARLALGGYFLRMAQYDLAVEQATQILEIEKNQPKALALLARCHLADRNLEEAKDVLQRITKVTDAGEDDPGTLAFRQLAQLDLLEGNLDSALARYREAVDKNPDSVPDRMGLGHALRRKGQIGEALQQYKQVLAVDSTNSTALLALAQIYRATGRLDLALDTCEQAKKISPSAPQVRFEMAAIQRAREQYDEAIAEYKAVLKDKPNHLRARVAIAETRFHSGDHSTAITMLTDLLGQQSTAVPAVRASLVSFYKRLGETDKAQSQLETLVQSTPKLLGAYDLAVLYIHKDKLPEAIRLIDQALDKQDAPTLHLARGTALQLQGKLDQAIDAFQKAREANPDNPRMASLLANAHLAAGKPDLARTAIRSVKVQPDLLNAYLALIDKLAGGGQQARLAANALNQAALYADANWLTLARERYQSLLDTLPDNLAVLHLLADVHERLDDPTHAIATYRRMLDARSGYEPALRNLARHYLAKDEPQKAEEAFRTLLGAKPDDLDLKLALATTLQRQDKLDECIDLYKQMIKQNPTHPIAYNNLAWIYASEDKHKDIKQAEAFATKAVDLTSADTAAGAACRDTLAWIYYMDERYDKAMDLAQKAADGMPGSAEIHYHLGMIYFKRNHRASAARHLTKTLQLEPDFEHKDQVNAVLDRIRRGSP